MFLLVSSLVEEGEKQNTRFRPSKVSGRESTPATSSSPPVSQESLTVKEKFIPPELSIWDYFIAKVIKVLSRSIFAQLSGNESVYNKCNCWCFQMFFLLWFRKFSFYQATFPPKNKYFAYISNQFLRQFLAKL